MVARASDEWRTMANLEGAKVHNEWRSAKFLGCLRRLTEEPAASLSH